MGNEFRPARVEKVLHTVTGFTDGRIILVECDAIYKHQMEIRTKIISRFVSVKYLIH